VTISTVIFDFGGVISSPLFVGIGEFEQAEGYPRGSLLRLLFGETHYIGVEGRAVAASLAADPDAAEAEGEVEDEPDWHLLEKGLLDMKTYFERMVEKAPAVLGRPIDMDAYGRFWRSSAPGVHWMTVHKMRELKARGLRIGLLTNNVKEFERQIYELTCSRLGVTAEETIFVDDNADNVAAAHEYGMEIVHFVEPWAALAVLDAIIERRGIKTR
jgi:FMN phosphatase YigB (HAD superfamily)